MSSETLMTKTQNSDNEAIQVCDVVDQSLGSIDNARINPNAYSAQGCS